jgi:hypothetical protein
MSQKILSIARRQSLRGKCSEQIRIRMVARRRLPDRQSGPHELR